MTKDKFEQDLQEIYTLIEEQNSELSQFYNSDSDLLDNFLHQYNINVNDQSRLALAQRLINKRDNNLRLYLKKDEHDQEDQDLIIRAAYHWTKNFYTQKQAELFFKFCQNGRHMLGMN